MKRELVTHISQRAIHRIPEVQIMVKLPPVLIACTLLGGLAAGLALRHDVEEAKYLEFGARFPAVVQVGGLGSGTLVAPDWILTAAHVPEMIKRMSKDAPLKVEIGGKEYEVARVVVLDERESAPDRHDIALLQLTEQVPKEIAPLTLWEEDMEPGTEFVLAGWGILAKGDEGLAVTPQAMALPTRKLRAGWNAIERLDADKALLFATFDGPDKGLELEAGPCIGDSGGPALIRVEGEGEAPDTWHVAGIIAHINDADEDGIVGEYGDEFGMTLVAAYAGWILETIGE